MRVDLFDFDLPPENIALRPASPRDSARLLLARGAAALEDRVVRDLPSLLRAGDMLVFNDTRVIPAQLEGRRGEARIGATLHKRLGLRQWQAFPMTETFCLVSTGMERQIPCSAAMISGFWPKLLKNSVMAGWGGRAPPHRSAPERRKHRHQAMLICGLARVRRAIAATFQAVRPHARARNQPAHVANRL